LPPTMFAMACLQYVAPLPVAHNDVTVYSARFSRPSVIATHATRYERRVRFVSYIALVLLELHLYACPLVMFTIIFVLTSTIDTR
jgi:hypothetical protein